MQILKDSFLALGQTVGVGTNVTIGTMLREQCGSRPGGNDAGWDQASGSPGRNKWIDIKATKSRGFNCDVLAPGQAGHTHLANQSHS